MKARPGAEPRACRAAFCRRSWRVTPGVLSPRSRSQDGRVVQESPEEDARVGPCGPTPPGHTQEIQKGLEGVVRAETLPAWTEGAGPDTRDVVGLPGLFRCTRPWGCLAVEVCWQGAAVPRLRAARSARVRVCVRSPLWWSFSLGRSCVHPVVKYENKSSVSRS